LAEGAILSSFLKAESIALVAEQLMERGVGVGQTTTKRGARRGHEQDVRKMPAPLDQEERGAC